MTCTENGTVPTMRNYIVHSELFNNQFCLIECKMHDNVCTHNVSLQQTQMIYAIQTQLKQLTSI